ncbi:MAG TPA: hypothetical protein VN734_12345 [Acidobacteriaceae bacterium]|nr:hypothetical protein [Acidobacteriaceae bacterium]
MLRLRIFARARGSSAIGGPAPREKIADALLPRRGRDNLTVPCWDTQSEEQNK